MQLDEVLATIVVPPETDLLSAIDRMTRAGDRVLLIADAERHLLGVMTDYDLRKAILRDRGITGLVADAMTTTPIVAPDTADLAEIQRLMALHRCHFLPVVDAERRLVGLHLLREMWQPQPRPLTSAVVMAGGFGKRLAPMTDAVPKPLLQVHGRPILFIVLDQILSEGFDRITLALHYKAEMIMEAVHRLAKYRDCVNFVVETEPLGTAGALGLLPERPRGAFLVMNADLITSIPLQEMLRQHRDEGNCATIATKLDVVSVPFGVVEVDGTKVTSLKEKPQLSMLVSTGTYVLEDAALDHVEKGQRLDMPDLLTKLMQAGRQVGCFPLHESWLDVGTPEQFRRANGPEAE